MALIGTKVNSDPLILVIVVCVWYKLRINIDPLIFERMINLSILFCRNPNIDESIQVHKCVYSKTKKKKKKWKKEKKKKNENKRKKRRSQEERNEKIWQIVIKKKKKGKTKTKERKEEEHKKKEMKKFDR